MNLCSYILDLYILSILYTVGIYKKKLKMLLKKIPVNKIILCFNVLGQEN